MNQKKIFNKYDNYKKMLAIQFIRNNRDLIIEAQKKRNFNVEKIIDDIVTFSYKNL